MWYVRRFKDVFFFFCTCIWGPISGIRDSALEMFRDSGFQEMWFGVIIRDEMGGLPLYSPRMEGFCPAVILPCSVLDIPDPNGGWSGGPPMWRDAIDARAIDNFYVYVLRFWKDPQDAIRWVSSHERQSDSGNIKCAYKPNKRLQL
jgi:hypothetical protein